MKEPFAHYAGDPVFHLDDADDYHRPLLYGTPPAARKARYDELPPSLRPLASALPLDWQGKLWHGLAVPWQGRMLYRSNHSAWFASESYAEYKARAEREAAPDGSP